MLIDTLRMALLALPLRNSIPVGNAEASASPASHSLPSLPRASAGLCRLGRHQSTTIYLTLPGPWQRKHKPKNTVLTLLVSASSDQAQDKRPLEVLCFSLYYVKKLTSLKLNIKQIHVADFFKHHLSHLFLL